jgi:hypothetical protein
VHGSLQQTLCIPTIPGGRKYKCRERMMQGNSPPAEDRTITHATTYATIDTRKLFFSIAELI